MEQTKFINGDVVMFDDKIRIIKEYKGYGSYDLYELDNFIIPGIPTDEITGVKLTPKILEKNGWKVRKHHKREFYDDTEYYEYYNPALISIQIRYYSENKEFYPFCFNNEIESKGGNEIKYVHQLQHLLFGLGLKSDMEV